MADGQNNAGTSLALQACVGSATCRADVNNIVCHRINGVVLFRLMVVQAYFTTM